MLICMQILTMFGMGGIIPSVTQMGYMGLMILGTVKYRHLNHYHLNLVLLCEISGSHGS
jgi:hypothetical protein